MIVTVKMFWPNQLIWIWKSYNRHSLLDKAIRYSHLIMKKESHVDATSLRQQLAELRWHAESVPG